MKEFLMLEQSEKRVFMLPACPLLSARHCKYTVATLCCCSEPDVLGRRVQVWQRTVHPDPLAVRQREGLHRR